MKVQYSKTYFEISLSQEAGASEKTKKKNHKSHAQNWEKHIS